MKCPKCGSDSIAEILYGYPAYTPALIEALEVGRIVLGGCITTGKEPRYICLGCGHTGARQKVEGPTRDTPPPDV